MSPGVTVVIDQPFDVVGAVLVPVLAILVSSGIAVWLARSERRAAERGVVRAGVATVVRALTDAGRAAVERDQAMLDEASAALQRATNELAVVLSAADSAVPKFVLAVFFRAGETGQATVLVRTSAWLGTAVESWHRGTLSTRDFVKHMPPDADKTWATTVDLSQWAALSAPG